MRLGFLGFAVDDLDKASRLGFDAVELATEAFGDPVEGPLDPASLDRARGQAEDSGVAITALAYYGLATTDELSDETVETAYRHVFDAAERLGVSTVASMSGFDGRLDWDGNLELFRRRFDPVAARAEERGLRIALENWMGFWGRLPYKPINMGGSPDTWEAWFELVPSPALGLEFDPSHLLWQGIDPVRALVDFAERVYHVHAKDVEILAERRYRAGVNGDTFRFRIPGYGDIDWARFISALDEIGYTGGVVIEHEDDLYSGERFDEGLTRGWHQLYPLVQPTAYFEMLRSAQA
jgi:sugar phosphate isomerase/epimerase